MDFVRLKEILSFWIGLNWEFAISVISLIISCSVVISNRIKSREKYDISVIDYKLTRSDILQLLIVITNYSDSPLSIKSVSCQGADCELEPKPIRGKPGSLRFAATSRFPICIEAHGCQYVYLEFLDYQHTPPVPGISLTLQICSTRKQEQKMLLLGDISHYLHTREQLQALRDLQKKT